MGGPDRWLITSFCFYFLLILGQLFELHQRFVAAAPIDLLPQLECELALIHGKPKGVTVYLYYREGIQVVDEESINEEDVEVSFDTMSDPDTDSYLYECE